MKDPVRRILLAGPLPIQDDVIGGTKVSFDALVRDLSEHAALEVEVVNTSRPLAHRSRLGRLVANTRGLGSLLARLHAAAPSADVVLWCVSATGALLAGPLVWLVCRLRRRPLAVRLFGGDFDRALDRAPAPWRWLARRTFLASPLLLLQTRALCDALAEHAGTRWLPTCRAPRAEPPGAERAPARSGARRFLFVGQLRPEKGVAEMLAASDALPADAELRLHGPAMPGFDVTLADGHERARWLGPLDPAEVATTLAAADVLVFPSYHEGEGLPGIVVEALQAGLPVIATRWRSLPEIVVHERNGLLVEPRDAAGLAAAMRRLYEDRELCDALAAGALRAGRDWASDEWHGRLVTWLLATFPSTARQEPEPRDGPRDESPPGPRSERRGEAA